MFLNKNNQNIKTRSNLLGKTFTRLLVLSRTDDIINNNGYKSPAWLCLCKCGSRVIVRAPCLKNGRTRSCGCLGPDSRMAEILSRSTYNPRLSNAKDIFTSLYKDGDLSFESFLDLSQKNCFYCNIGPSNKKKIKKKKCSEFMRENSLFIYNGLDRINSDLPHNANNVVPCCYICNRAKRHYSLNFFIEFINKLDNSNIFIGDIGYRDLSKDIDMCNLNELYFGRAVKTKFKSGYNNGDLTIDQFYKLSQLNCYYCNSSPKNMSKIASKTYLYNGLDRIDNKLPHNYNNCVPCCKICNFAKSNLDVDVFLDWTYRIKNNIQKITEHAKCL